jgi:hypothetical protein
MHGRQIVPWQGGKPEAVVWLGWALFYGRRPVWAALAIGCAAFAAIVRWEEQRLLGRFGGGYRACLAEVPRWVPRAPGAGKDPLPVHRPAAPYPACSRRGDGMQGF